MCHFQSSSKISLDAYDALGFLLNFAPEHDSPITLACLTRLSCQSMPERVTAPFTASRFGIQLHPPCKMRVWPRSS